jgi:DNA mismatch repair protein MutL
VIAGNRIEVAEEKKVDLPPENKISDHNGASSEVAEPIKDEQKSSESVSDEPERIEPVKIEYRIVGEVFNSYILVELDEKMLLIDKHAAHERIIFEQLKRNMYSHQLSSQLLMLPIDVMLMSDEVSAIEEYRSELEAVGFEFSCSRNTVSVTAIPVGIEQDAVVDMFAVVADRIKSGTGKIELTRNIIFEKALYQASCKAAIKAGREYAKGHGEWLVAKLMELPDITFCPHGRPVAMELSKKNIDRQFERT